MCSTRHKRIATILLVTIFVILILGSFTTLGVQFYQVNIGNPVHEVPHWYAKVLILIIGIVLIPITIALIHFSKLAKLKALCKVAILLLVFFTVFVIGAITVL